jgi:RNA polymerase sigma-70 factor (ECF subfamily)
MEFWNLYNTHSKKIYNYLLWYLGNRQDAEDLTGTIFLKARSNFDTLRDPDKVLPWLWSITRNTANNFYRDRKRELQIEQIPIDFSSRCENGYKKIRLWAALNKLSDPDREILILREYHGYSYAELVEIIGNTIPGIKSRLFRARENLRKQYFSLEV